MKLTHSLLAALTIFAISQTAHAEEELQTIVFNSRTELPVNKSVSPEEVSKVGKAPGSKGFCVLYVNAPPLSQPVIPANREFLVKAELSGVLYLYDPATRKFAGKISCTVDGMAITDALKTYLDISPKGGIKVYEIKAEQEESIEQDNWVLPAT